MTSTKLRGEYVAVALAVTLLATIALIPIKKRFGRKSSYVQTKRRHVPRS